MKCSACKEVAYCNKDHQKADWKEHKEQCKFIRDHKESVWIEIPPNEGNGLGCTMINHVFPNHEAGMNFVMEQRRVANDRSPVLKSQWAEILGWDMAIYCASGSGRGGINGAGIYLGCDLQSGLTRWNNLAGTIYVTGRNVRGQTLSSNVLWGMLNMIWDAMDYYDGTISSDPAPYFARWVPRYKAGTWQPAGGDGGIDVYSVDARNSMDPFQEHN